jgi:hypothetical protein
MEDRQIGFLVEGKPCNGVPPWPLHEEALSAGQELIRMIVEDDELGVATALENAESAVLTDFQGQTALHLAIVCCSFKAFQTVVLRAPHLIRARDRYAS